MTEITRILPAEARQRVQSGAALLVCAYENSALFESNRLEGAISLEEFRSLLPGMDKDREIIFYCA